MTGEITAQRSRIQPNYFLIRLDGRLWRVCHKDNLPSRWPGIQILGGES